MQICRVAALASTAAPFRLWARTSRSDQRCLFAAATSRPAIESQGDTAVVLTSQLPTVRRGRRSASTSHADSVQAYLQTALGYETPAAHSVAARAGLGASGSIVQLSTCQGWVTFLTQLSAGDATTVRAILQLAPALLARTFDQQRQADLEQLQHLLLTSLDIDQHDFLLMVRRQPQLLMAVPHTLAAAIHFVSQLGGDAAALRQAVIRNPQLLTASVAGLIGKMAWLTGPLGAAPASALGILPSVVQSAVATTLEPHRLWFLQQGFTPEDVLRLAHRNPALLYRSITVLQRRLDFFTHTCGVPADSVVRMLAAQPSVWTHDLEGHLMRLKLHYWHDELRFSYQDLLRVPNFLACSLTRIAVRHRAMADLVGVVTSPASFCVDLICNSSAESVGFGPRLFRSFTKQCLAAGGAMAHVLQPLAAQLSQPAHRKEWLAELQSFDLVTPAGPTTAQCNELYAALFAIYERDWPLSAAGLKWTVAEADAKAADDSARASARAKWTADLLEVKLVAAAAAADTKAAVKLVAAAAAADTKAAVKAASASLRAAKSAKAAAKAEAASARVVARAAAGEAKMAKAAAKAATREETVGASF